MDSWKLNSVKKKKLMALLNHFNVGDVLLFKMQTFSLQEKNLKPFYYQTLTSAFTDVIATSTGQHTKKSSPLITEGDQCSVLKM